MPLVFVSYARENQDFVLRLVHDLRQHGVPIWFDQLAIPAGAQWDVVIENALEDATHVLLVMSKASVNSPNVRDEIDMAIDEDKTIIPILLEDCRRPLRVRRLQYMDFRGGYENALQGLLAALPRYGLPMRQSRMSPRQATYFYFWTTLLDRARTQTSLHAHISPGKRNVIAASAGKPGLKFRYALHRRDASVQLDIATPDRARNKAIFDTLTAAKPAVEAAFGGPLEWERRDGNKASRIKKTLPLAGLDNEANWPDIQTAMIAAMIRLADALRPHIDALPD